MDYSPQIVGGIVIFWAVVKHMHDCWHCLCTGCVVEAAVVPVRCGEKDRHGIHGIHRQYM